MQDEPISFRTVIKIFSIIVGFMVVVGYVLFQARFMIVGPQIILLEETTMKHNDRTVVFKGQTHNITHLWLNDRPIYTNASGYFEEAMVLENGYTVATLRAEDRYGRSTEVTRPFVYTATCFQ